VIASRTNCGWTISTAWAAAAADNLAEVIAQNLLGLSRHPHVSVFPKISPRDAQ